MAIAPHSRLIAAIRPDDLFILGCLKQRPCLANLGVTASGRPQVWVGQQSYWIPIFAELEDQPAFGRLTSSSCRGLGDRRDPDTSDDSPRACGARLGLEIPLFPPQLGNGKFLGA